MKIRDSVAFVTGANRGLGLVLRRNCSLPTRKRFTPWPKTQKASWSPRAQSPWRRPGARVTPVIRKIRIFHGPSHPQVY
jgi:hypothetical protein